MSKTYSKTIATDGLQNLVANIGTAMDRKNTTTFINDTSRTYEELAAMYSGWLSRRIVDLIPDEALKRSWQIFCPSWEPEKIEALEHYAKVNLNLQQQLEEALKSARLFGGAVILCIADSRFGAFSNELPTYLPKNSLLGLQAFDAWQCMPNLINFSNVLAKNYRQPASYSIGSAGLQISDYSVNENGDLQADTIIGTNVNWTRVRRIDGLFLPWYSRQRNNYWGQSVLASAYDAVLNASSVDTSVATLLFRASVPVLKVQDLASIISDPEAKDAFLERVNILNYGASNNNMAIIDAEESLESFEPGNISNLDGVLERYYILISAATGIPVTKLVGESARGLNATGQEDLDNYYDTLENYQTRVVKPILMDIYKKWIVPSLFDELIPKDFDIVFQPLERVSPEKKQQQDSEFLSMLTSALDAELIDKKIARKELQERKVFGYFDKTELERLENEKEENNMDLNEALDAADGLVFNKGE